MDVILWLVLILLSIIAFFGAFSVYFLLRTGVPFIPTKDAIVEKMLKIVEFHNEQIIYELGCGNGKLLFAIKKILDQNGLQNSKIRGYELIVPLVWWIKIKRLCTGKTSNQVEIFSRDFFRQDLSKADIIFCYLFPPIMQRISREIWPNLQSGTILISHAFSIDNLEPKEVVGVAGTKIYVYEK